MIVLSFRVVFLESLIPNMKLVFTFTEIIIISILPEGRS